jgi:hypothetical protein
MSEHSDLSPKGLSDQGVAPDPEIAEQSFPVTGAHWLDGWVVVGDTWR